MIFIGRDKVKDMEKLKVIVKISDLIPLIIVLKFLFACTFRITDRVEHNSQVHGSVYSKVYGLLMYQ